MADDPARCDGVTTLGVDERICHHVSEKDRGPRALTGMVDLTRDQDGRTRARLLDLIPLAGQERLRRLAHRAARRTSPPSMTTSPWTSHLARGRISADVVTPSLLGGTRLTVSARFCNGPN
jgi:hypothetical protein